MRCGARCFAFGFPVKKLNAANPSAITAKIGRTEPRSADFRPRSDDSTEAFRARTRIIHEGVDVEAIRPATVAGPVVLPDGTAIRGDAPLITCATPGYLKQYGTPAYPDELKNGHRLVSYVFSQTGRSVPFRFARDGEKTEIKVEHRIGVNESNAHLAACLAGLGIVQTFGYAAQAPINEGALVEILKPWRPSVR